MQTSCRTTSREIGASMMLAKLIPFVSTDSCSARIVRLSVRLFDSIRLFTVTV